MQSRGRSQRLVRGAVQVSWVGGQSQGDPSYCCCSQQPKPSPTPSSPLATRIPGPHQVSWVEAPPTPKVQQLALANPEEEEQEEDDYQDEEKGPEDVLTAHVRALARARSSYVAGQYRGLRARLASCSGNPHRPGDPAIELLQDVRHLLLDLQDHLAKDPSVRAILGSRGAKDQQKQEDLGNGRGLEGPLSTASLLGPWFAFLSNVCVSTGGTTACFPTDLLVGLPLGQETLRHPFACPCFCG